MQPTNHPPMKLTKYFRLSYCCFDRQKLDNAIDFKFNWWKHEKVSTWILEKTCKQIDFGMHVLREQTNVHANQNLRNLKDCLPEIYNSSFLCIVKCGA